MDPTKYRSMKVAELLKEYEGAVTRLNGSIFRNQGRNAETHQAVLDAIRDELTARTGEVAA